MRAEILPFAAEHIAAAAELLAARHRVDRAREPALPECFEDPSAARGPIADDLGKDGAAGVAALRDGRLVGYLIGAPNAVAPERIYSPFVLPRAASHRYAGVALDPGATDDGYSALYGALAARWLAEELSAHDVQVPAADRVAQEAWFALGFGRSLTLAVRELDADPASVQDHGPIEVRQATTDDEADVQRLVQELFSTFADPPIFMPVIPESWPELRDHCRALLAAPASPVWLAVADGKVVGLQIFLTPASPEWFLSPMVADERSIYLLFACTDPEARSSGVGAALTARTLAWASAEGYERCYLHFLPASRAAAFWRNQGFRPVVHYLARIIDPRVAGP